MGQAASTLWSKLRIIQSADDKNTFGLPALLNTKTRACSKYSSIILIAVILFLYTLLLVRMQQILRIISFTSTPAIAACFNFSISARIHTTIMVFRLFCLFGKCLQFVPKG